jgi:hypothetical protein
MVRGMMMREKGRKEEECLKKKDEAAQKIAYLWRQFKEIKKRKKEKKNLIFMQMTKIITDMMRKVFEILDEKLGKKIRVRD